MAEDHGSPRWKKAKLQGPSRQQVDSLRPRWSRLRCFWGLQPPSLPPRKASNFEFQTHEDLRGRGAKPPSMEVNDGLGTSLSSSISSDSEEEPCPLQVIIMAALTG
ncbi:hypothetical protein XENORESO_013215 [Xenotaenia resolanae]|uniref:Uncharacterized protein n=1 Tax=Xenotaenia resolanae TaxID=208358 RepID=A0ABV0W9R7_9TELE